MDSFHFKNWIDFVFQYIEYRQIEINTGQLFLTKLGKLLLTTFRSIGFASAPLYLY